MNAWVISDSEDLILRIRSSLQELNISCPSTRILSVAAADRLGSVGCEDSAVLFLAEECISGETIEAIRRIRSNSKAPLAVVSQTDEYGTVLKSIRAGAADFLTADETLSTEIKGFLRRVALSHSHQDSQGKQFCIVPCNFSSDASFLAVNMASVIARRMNSCCLIDLQLRGGDAALLLNLSPRHTVYDLLTQPHPVDEAMFSQALTRHESGIELLAGPALFSNLQPIQPRMCEDILSSARVRHRYVVIISEDIQHAEQLRALAASDCVFLTTRLDLPSLHRTQGHIEYLAQNNVGSDHVRVVAINTGQPGELPLAEVKKLLRISSLVCIPADPCAMTVSINVGNPIVLDAPRSKTSGALVELVDSFIGCEENSDRVASGRSWTVTKEAAASVVHMLAFRR